MEDKYMFNGKERKTLLKELESKIEVLHSNVILMEHDFMALKDGGSELFIKDFEYRKEMIRKNMIDTNVLLTRLKEL